MRVAASIEVVWQLAAREAVAGEFKDIEPEHLFAALLKFAELPLGDLEKVAAEAAAVQALAAEARGIRDELKQRAIDSTRVRHALREQLGKGGFPFPGGAVHRSQASRDLFDAAATLAADAGSDALTAAHLLQATLVCPSSTIAGLLGRSAASVAPAQVPSATPLLDAVGRDLARLAAEGGLRAAAGYDAECRALLQVLGRPSRKSVFLVAESDDAARTVIEAAALSLAKNEMPRGAHGRRIVDVSALTDIMMAGGEPEGHLVMLFAEAARSKDVVLFLPHLDPAGGPGEFAERGRVLHSRLRADSLQWVCRITQRTLTSWVEPDKTWTRWADVLHVRDRQTRDLPHEL